MPHDLQVINARLPDRDGLWTVALRQGKIAAIAPKTEPVAIAADESGTQTLDAHEGLLIPGLVDGHIHLDKALLLDRHPAQAGTFAEAMAATLKLKQSFTVADIQSRARQCSKPPSSLALPPCAAMWKLTLQRGCGPWQRCCLCAKSMPGA